MGIIGQPIILGGGTSATINATYPVGATLMWRKVIPSTRATSGNPDDNPIIYQAPDKSGFHSFSIDKIGEWEIIIVYEDLIKYQTVTVNSKDQIVNVTLTFANIYGIYRDEGSRYPRWIRTDSAVGMDATASIGSTAGSSDFDNVYPWSEMKRETLATGDVMVKIPKFYFRRYADNGMQYIQIADGKTPNFEVHPAFFDDNGNELDCIYVGAYKTSINHKSESGVDLKVDIKRSEARTAAKNKGAGWGIIDFNTTSAIQMLFLVEFADFDAQSRIGRGRVGTTPILGSGTCDNVPNLTGIMSTTGNLDVVWRGIECLWGNVWEWVDGINFYNGEIYYCDKRSAYADGTKTNYKVARILNGFPWEGVCADYPCPNDAFTHLFIPTGWAVGTPGTDHTSDGIWVPEDGWRCPMRGGDCRDGDRAGLFAMDFTQGSNNVSGYTGYRLLYIPSA